MKEKLLNFIKKLLKIHSPSPKPAGYRPYRKDISNHKPIIAYLCDGKACGDKCPNKECYHTFDISHAINFTPMPNENGTVTVYEEDYSMPWWGFLMHFECIAIEHGFRLCMERAPLGCGIFFYFRDPESGLRSKDVVVHLNHDYEAEKIVGMLEELAEQFKKDLTVGTINEEVEIQ